MQIDRLLEIVWLLLSRKKMTAKELSERFQVSTRTIYRDIDTLSLAGIPVYSSKGYGGGIGLIQDYVLDKSLLSENERSDILFALQSLQATKLPEVGNILEKVSAMFNNERKENWIEVDFSHWGSEPGEKMKFVYLKEAILNSKVLSFSYINSNGEKSRRDMDPLRLFFKGNAWYVQGFCRKRANIRIFRVSRMKDLVICEESFVRSVHENMLANPECSLSEQRTVTLRIKFSHEVSHRVYDEFPESLIEHGEDGTFTVCIEYPYDEWVIGYVLSFGSYAEVIEPEFLREIIKIRAAEILKKYS